MDSFIHALRLNPALSHKIRSLVITRPDGGHVVMLLAHLVPLTSLANLGTLVLRIDQKVHYEFLFPISMRSLFPIISKFPTLHSLTLDGLYFLDDTVFEEKGRSRRFSCSTDRSGTLQHLRCAIVPGLLGLSTDLPYVGTVLKRLERDNLLAPSGLKTIDMPQYIPWTTPYSSQALLKTIRGVDQLEKFGAMVSTERPQVAWASLKMTYALETIANFPGLRSIHLCYATDPDANIGGVIAGDGIQHKVFLEQLSQTFFIEQLQQHFNRRPIPNAHLEEVLLTIASPITPLVAAWTPLLPSLAETLCRRTDYPGFRRLHACLVIVGQASNAHREKLSLLFSAFRRDGVEVELEVRTFEDNIGDPDDADDYDADEYYADEYDADEYDDNFGYGSDYGGYDVTPDFDYSGYNSYDDFDDDGHVDLDDEFDPSTYGFDWENFVG